MHGGRLHGRGVCIVGVCVRGAACVAGETATAADGTHPTGMHSCFSYIYKVSRFSGVLVNAPRTVYNNYRSVNYWQWLLTRLSIHLHGHYLQCYYVHRHLHNAWYNKAYSLIGKPYLAIIASNESGKENMTRFCTWTPVYTIDRCYFFLETDQCLWYHFVLVYGGLSFGLYKIFIRDAQQDLCTIIPAIRLICCLGDSGAVVKFSQMVTCKNVIRKRQVTMV